jgi:hypothetical protein
MKYGMMFAAVWFTFAALSSEEAKAQFGVEASLTGMYDDNINNNYLQISDKISTMSLNAGYGKELGTWYARGYYDGILNYFQSVTERTNQFHSGNLAFSHLSGDNDEDVLNIGTSYGEGYYHGDYSFYDHSLWSAYVNYKQFLSERIINKIGYSFRSVGFAQLSDFSYSEHTVYGNFSFALPTNTTLIVQADLGSKFYSTANPAAETGGMRKSSLSIMPSVTQLTGFLRIGQSIVEGTGLSLTTKYQWNIQKQTRYLSSSYGVISDDELFDDHYGYEGLQAYLMLTQVVSESMLLRITGGTQARIYSSLSAYDLAGNAVADQRIDERAYVSVFLQKNFDAGFSVKAAYDLIRNSSNDAFYDYSNNAVTLEVTVPF